MKKTVDNDTTTKHINQNKMKRKEIENHITYCEEQFKICNRKSNKLKHYYFKKQIEVAKRKLLTFKSE